MRGSLTGARLHLSGGIPPFTRNFNLSPITPVAEFGVMVKLGLTVIRIETDFGGELESVTVITSVTPVVCPASQCTPLPVGSPLPPELFSVRLIVYGNVPPLI